MPSHTNLHSDSADNPEDHIDLPVKEWISSVEEWQAVALTKADIARLTSDLASRRTIVLFLLWAYGLLVASTLLIFFLQGFGLWRFKLDGSTLNWLGAATIGEIAGLLTVTIKSLFPSGQTSKIPRSGTKR
jgi:hypothetical protein